MWRNGRWDHDGMVTVVRESMCPPKPDLEVQEISQATYRRLRLLEEIVSFDTPRLELIFPVVGRL